MKAEEGKVYAIIQQGKVSQIFTHEDLKEWNENHIFVVEVKEKDRSFVNDGTSYDEKKRKFIRPSIEEAKTLHLEYINNRFESELADIRAEYIPQDEFSTWELQNAQAREFLANGTPAPLLEILAQNRGIELRALCEKIAQKNNDYNTKLFTLMGYRQNLRAQIENAKSFDEIAAIHYLSPYGYE